MTEEKYLHQVNLRGYSTGRGVGMRTQLLYYPSQYHQQVQAEISRYGFKRWHVYASQVFHSNYGFVIAPAEIAADIEAFIQGVGNDKNSTGPRPKI